jgi:hypothetical protein
MELVCLGNRAKVRVLADIYEASRRGWNLNKIKGQMFVGRCQLFPVDEREEVNLNQEFRLATAKPEDVGSMLTYCRLWFDFSNHCTRFKGHHTTALFYE